MALNLAGARVALAAAFMTRTLRTTGRELNVSERCGLSPQGGDVAAQDGLRAERGQYRLTLPATTTLELVPGERIAIDEVPGRLFTVVWSPPASNLNLARIYGLTEVR